MRRCWATITLLVPFWPSLLIAGSGHNAPFPGERTILRSPDRRHVLRWVPPASGADQHSLLLSDVDGRVEVELLAFPRHVEAFWSPSGSRLAVTNAWASDESTVLVWATLDAHPRDLLEELAAQEGQRVARWNAHHLYLEATGWRGDGMLMLRLWGYGDPSLPLLTRRYTYLVGRGFAPQ
jgi:hypothetical protein